MAEHYSFGIGPLVRLAVQLQQHFCSHRYDLADLSPRNAAGMVRCRCYKCAAVHTADCGLHLPGFFDRNSPAGVQGVDRG